MKGVLTLLLLLFFLFDAQSQKYKANWESVKQFDPASWFQDAKFGIYFHWGPYSVPAYRTEWYSHWMYVEGHEVNKHHVKKYGSVKDFGYKDFIPLFKAEKFDADQWVELFVKAGAKFAGPVAEHADGFAMWDSRLTEWDAMDKGPKRDIVGEIAKAVRKTDMKFITTFHHQWLYAWYPTQDKNADASNPEYEDLYGPSLPTGAFEMAEEDPKFMPDERFNNRWASRVKEVVDMYQPDLVYFDNKLNIINEKDRLDFLAYYYNKAHEWDKEVVVTYKAKDFKEGAAVLDLERSRMSSIRDFPWLTDDSIDWGSWCDVQDPDYKSTNRIIDFLVDVVSKNGCVLLNVTPKANGEIPKPVSERLLEIGQWLEINGEAIYETRPWKVFGEGPTRTVEGHLSERQNKDNTAEDIRFTTRGGILYAIVLDWPGSSVRIRSLKVGTELFRKKIKSIQLLGSDQELDWTHDEAGLTIQTPEQKPCDHAFVFRIE